MHKKNRERVAEGKRPRGGRDNVGDVARKLRMFNRQHEMRSSWHEPDEQDVTAEMVGNHLDNACGSVVSGEALEKGFQEFVIRLRKGEGDPTDQNLANLLAAAAMGGGLRPEELRMLRGARDDFGIPFDFVVHNKAARYLCWDLVARGFMVRDQDNRQYVITEEGIAILGEYA